MIFYFGLCLCLVALETQSSVLPNSTTATTSRKFPKNFLFGAGTAAYQIEGAWNVDGKGPSIWDVYIHSNPTIIDNSSNGDIAADSYNKYKRDVEMVRELGLDAYRFSLSWARILPTGFPNKINKAAIDYYNNLINELLANGIEPFVTIYHWDIPETLQDLGGWANPYVVQWFEDYARVVFENFGDRVKYWTVINEPASVCNLPYMSYPGVFFAPALNSSGIGDYMCLKNVLMAHASVYHLYKNEYDNGAEVGITIDVDTMVPRRDTEEDNIAVAIAEDFFWKLFADPIASSNGGFPERFIKQIEEKSAQQGFFRSRLPVLTDEEKRFIQGSYDFLGLNCYTSHLVSKSGDTSDVEPSFINDRGVEMVLYASEISGGTIDAGGFVVSKHKIEDGQEGLLCIVFSPNSNIYVIYPQRRGRGHFYKVLTNMKALYNNPKLYITEVGYSALKNTTGEEDDNRIAHHRAILTELLDAKEDGVQVEGYFVWSLMDCFEWKGGYSVGLGLYNVDFNDPERPRTPRKSAFVYKEIIKTRTLDYNYEPPKDRQMTIDN